MRRLIAVLIVSLLFASGLSWQSGGYAQQTPEAEATATISEWRSVLDAVEAGLADTEISDTDLALMRDRLDGVRSDVRKWITELTVELEAVQKEMQAFGPAPAEGQEPEPEAVAVQRQELQGQLNEISGHIKEAELLIGRIAVDLSKLGELRRSRFTEKVFQRGMSPLSPSIWRLALPEMRSISASVTGSTVRFVSSDTFKQRLAGSIYALLAAILAAVVLVWPVQRWTLKKFGRDPSIQRPTFMQSLRATLVVGVARAFLPTVAVGLVYLAALSGGLLGDAGKSFAQALFLGVVLFTWSVAFFRASLSPANPGWRIVPIPSKLARAVQSVVIALALAFSVDIVLSEVIVSYSARLAVTALRDFVLAAFVILILANLLLRQQIWAPEDTSEPPRWRWLRLMLSTGLMVVLMAGAAGYVAFARFIATQIVMTGGLVLVVLVLNRLGREFISHALSEETWIGESLRDKLRMDDESASRSEFWIGLGYDTVLALLGLVIAAFIWGADYKDVADWTYQLLFGLKIGNFTFSLVSVFTAILLFVGLVLATRIVQHVLAEKVLTQTQMDKGTRHSIRIGIGYIGIILAALVGISALGLDLSKLAIVAGALSVGIGFGLQNVVNNFVSGLILLVERPVKVGDWIVVGDKQGYVKRIKVRATEIQTFDRASVFVPNSHLISESVTNWTYADKMGRVIIPVGVAYGTDSGKVMEALLKIAKDHSEVLRDPGPAAVFRGFGDSALNFELRCFLKDVERTISVTSDLCVEIDNAFRDLGIEIPFPQQDVYVRQFVPASKS